MDALLHAAMRTQAEIKAENEICARTMVSLRKQAEVMGWSLDQALAEVIPSTRKRLVAYLSDEPRETGDAWAGGFADNH
jgi:hypothetical protein